MDEERGRQWLAAQDAVEAEYVRRLITDLEFEVRVLRLYGNKDCTGQADAQLERKRAGLKCDFED